MSDPKSLIIGRWITHAEELIPGTPNYYGPAAFIAAYDIKSDGTLAVKVHSLIQGDHRTLNGVGQYSVAWNPLGIAEGVLTPEFGFGTISLNFFVRSKDELVWVMTEASDHKPPIAHGIFLRVSALNT